MQWPAAEVQLIRHYMAKQPAAEDRIEIAVASLHASFFNANRAQNAAPRSAVDFLPYFDPWPQPEPAGTDRYNDVDRELLAALMR